MTEPFVGEIQLFGFNFAPYGWASCNGATLAIQQNTALFSLLGTQYGGDGQTTFQLPNFVNRVATEQGQAVGFHHVRTRHQRQRPALGDLLGRISAQTAKQVMIQKIREAERDALYDEYLDLRSQLISGQVTRVDRGTVIVKLDKIEALLPRSEQIRKENFRTGDRLRYRRGASSAQRAADRARGRR